MQNNVTELTQKLLRSLDNNYNVIDMPTVIDIISLLEKVAITKELLETTRLGKHVNELRRNTKNESLAKRAKELVKKWRSMVIPESNGQIKPIVVSDPDDTKGKKRPAKDKVENHGVKRPRVNGQSSEFDFSDNSNSSFKDVIHLVDTKRELTVNTDSNSSCAEKQDPLLKEQLPKKRGRKKGSRNHSSLLDEAETSFTNKMAVSRGNAKVKTTQELVASLHNKSSIVLPPLPTKPIEDLNERAAKLTERVSIIDQKLNTNTGRYKSGQRKRNERVMESGVVVNVPSAASGAFGGAERATFPQLEEEIIVVDDADSETTSDIVSDKIETEPAKPEQSPPPPTAVSLSIEDALARLPPLDTSTLDSTDSSEPPCTCQSKERKSDFSIDDDEEDVDLGPKFEFLEDCNCPSRIYLQEKYHLTSVTDDRVHALHSTYLPNVNGNEGLGGPKPEPRRLENGLYANVVPDVNAERLSKHGADFTCENYKKYSISNCGGCGGEGVTFREWHEVVETPSYNGEVLKILPYVIID